MSVRTVVLQIVEWLTLDAVERPSLVMAYFDQPDAISHFNRSAAAVNIFFLCVLDF